ncbi:hypothetical protein BamMEX5DRAFT_3391 [Burkholderia ambifaria MEX-5]|uniref:Uncharacterized protein n=2 Tax=Burkholderia ambifaria TaxID=152480 RepID=B1T6H5_9BURK|nr:hypothetical protein BamMEX5DRAFT_3391 [Burkholderia ambifaria MEX-5]
MQVKCGNALADRFFAIWRTVGLESPGMESQAGFGEQPPGRKNADCGYGR